MTENTDNAAYEAFAIRFKRALSTSDGANLSQTDIAKFLNVSSQQINNYMAGRRMPSIAAAERICQLTGVSFEWLMTGKSPKTSRSLKEVWSEASSSEREELLSMLLSQLETFKN
jgi:transcriptional regulator with XRE-family HTH domain